MTSSASTAHTEGYLTETIISLDLDTECATRLCKSYCSVGGSSYRSPCVYSWDTTNCGVAICPSLNIQANLLLANATGLLVTHGAIIEVNADSDWHCVPGTGMTNEYSYPGFIGTVYNGEATLRGFKLFQYMACSSFN